MLMPSTIAVALLCDVSVAVPLTDCAAPSALRMRSAGHDARKKSLQAKRTVTGPLFHPASFASGDRDPLMVGAVVSRTVIVSCAAAVRPAPSVAVHVTVVGPSGNRVPAAREYAIVGVLATSD